MPISKIQVDEYQCAWCGYKWINRVNGKDGPIPSKYAKCKRPSWINGEADIMTPEENGLRRRIKRLDEYYDEYRCDRLNIEWPAGLVEKFLSLDNPRPSIWQLRELVYPLGDISHDIQKYPGYIPDPDKPGYLKRDDSHYMPDPDRPGRMKYNDDYSGPGEYDKLVKQEAQKRIEIMLSILKSRGIDYDPAPAIVKQRQEREERKRQQVKRQEELSKLSPEERHRVLQEEYNEILSSTRGK